MNHFIEEHWRNGLFTIASDGTLHSYRCFSLHLHHIRTILHIFLFKSILLLLLLLLFMLFSQELFYVID